jgi:hypothetical protein
MSAGIGFEGGDALFLDQPQDSTATVTVTPQTGRVVLFDGQNHLKTGFGIFEIFCLSCFR